MNTVSIDNVKAKMASENANFYFITFVSPNGDFYSWREQGFELAISQQNGIYKPFYPIKAQVAETQFFQAFTNAKKLPFEGGHLSIAGLPKFSNS